MAPLIYLSEIFLISGHSKRILMIEGESPSIDILSYHDPSLQFLLGIEKIMNFNIS